MYVKHSDVHAAFECMSVILVDTLHFSFVSHSHVHSTLHQEEGASNYLDRCLISNTSLATPYMDILYTGEYPLQSVVVITLPRSSQQVIREYVVYSRLASSSLSLVMIPSSILRPCLAKCS